MKFTKAITLLFVLLMATTIMAQDYTVDGFKTRVENLQDDAAIVEVCKEFISNAADMDVARTAQDTWRQLDAESARTYFKSLMDSDAASAKNVYLYGRLAESRSEQVMLGRKAIELDPKFSYGYRLALATYMSYLFDGRGDKDQQAELEEMLPADEHQFAVLVELEPEADYPLSFQYSYQKYKGQWEDALLTLEKGLTMEARWASNMEKATCYAGIGRYEEAEMAVAIEIDAAVAAGQIGADKRDEYVGRYYSSALMSAKAYDEAIKFSMSNEGWESDNGILYNIACVHSIRGDKDTAFEYLTKAGAHGWDDAEHPKRDSDLEGLRDDPRFEAVVAIYQSNWDKGAPERKAETLASKISKPAPDWSLEDANGTVVDLADLRGKVLILDFWATWCGPCRMAMPVIDEYIKNQKPEDVMVFSVNVWEKGKKKPAEFMVENDYAMILLYGNDDLAKAYDVTGIPHLCVIDKEGNIRYVESGYGPRLAENLLWWTEDLL